MLRLLAFLLVFATAAVQAQTISTDLEGKLVELKNKFTQPVRNPSIGQAKYIAFYCGGGLVWTVSSVHS